MIAIVASATLLGVEGRPVSIEVHVSNGLPGFTIVGLPDASCREARDRVRAALLTSDLPWLIRRVTVNLAPSGIRKAGAGLDLPIAVGVLVAAEAVKAEAIADMAFIGELGLDGTLRPVTGTVPLVDALSASVVVVAPSSAAQARLVGRHDVRVATTLRSLVDALTGNAPWEPLPPAVTHLPTLGEPDLSDVRGQRLGRFAVEVAAAGGHHLLLTGPPGAGKTLLARRLPGLLPALAPNEALETTKVHSAAGLELPPAGLVTRPPLRAPHHGASSVSLIGGGTAWMRPGEISCAHNGILLLDEMGEFSPVALDSLRQPLEDGVVRVCRARCSLSFPARFLLVATMNPCPCGDGGPPGSCRCTDAARARYGRRLSGPLLDRFDLRIPIARADPGELLGGAAGESTSTVSQRVADVRALAVERGLRSNAELPARRLDELAPLSPAARRVVEWRLRSGTLSARGLHRVRRVARTLADLDGGGTVVGEEQVCMALELRVDLPALEAAS